MQNIRVSISWFVRAAGMLLILLVSAELALRTLYVNPSRRTVDAVVGPCYEPGANIVYAEEGYARSHTNEMGLLDGPLRDPPPPHRVLLLGDSYIEAKQVPRRFRMDEVAESLLGTDYEVVNGGHSGWGPADTVPFLSKYSEYIRPDVIVLSVSVQDLEQLESPANSRLRLVDGQWAVHSEIYPTERSAVHAFSRRITHTSALATLIRRRLQTLFETEFTRLRTKFASGKPKPANRAAEPRPPEPWGRLVGVLRPLESLGVPVVLLYIPKGEYFHGGMPEVATPFSNQVRDLAKERGHQFIDPTLEFAVEFNTTKTPAHGFWNSKIGTGHLNRTGHRIIGHLLADAIQEATR